MNRLQLLLALACVVPETIQHLLYRMAGRHPKRYFTFVAPAVVLYIVQLLIWLRLLNGAKLGVMIPFIAISHVTVALASKVLFGERVDARRWIAIILVVAGAILLGHK